MATDTAAKPAKATDDHGGDQSPPELDTATLFRLVVERLRLLSPAGMTNPRFVWDIPGNAVPGSLPLAVPEPKLSELAADILEVLRDAGGWLTGPEIAHRIDPNGGTVDRTSGSFQRAAGELIDAGLIESVKRKGYKAKQL